MMVIAWCIKLFASNDTEVEVNSFLCYETDLWSPSNQKEKQGWSLNENTTWFHKTIPSPWVNNLNSTWRRIQIMKNDNLKVRWPGFDSRQRQDISLLRRVQIGSRATQPHIQRVPGTLSPGLMRPGHEADHSPPFSVEVKNGWALPPLRHTSS
jgi:hypothetical protein